MIIKFEDLQEFVEFLRKSCSVRQLTTFSPAPNESGEFFRALAENHWVVAHLNAKGELCIFTDDKYQVVLWDRWAKRSKSKPVAAPTTVSATERLKALLLGTLLPGKSAAKTAPPSAKPKTALLKSKSGSTSETIDLSS